MKKTCEHQDIAESQVMCAHVEKQFQAERNTLRNGISLYTILCSIIKFSGWEKYEKDKTKETLSNVVKLETRLS